MIILDHVGLFRTKKHTKQTYLFLVDFKIKQQIFNANLVDLLGILEIFFPLYLRFI